MNRFSKYLKMALVVMLLVLQLATPLTGIVFATDNNQDETTDEVDLEFDLELDINLDFTQADEAVLDTAPQPAYTGDVPEMLFVDDMLADIEDTELFLPILPTNAANAAPGSGLVQFVLEPVAHSVYTNYTQTASGRWINLARARAASFNAGTVFHRVFTTATGNAYVGVNGRYGRDALFLGVSPNGARYRVLVAGMIGYVNRVDTLTPQNITVSAIHYGDTTATAGTIQVRANAQFVPFNTYPNNPENGGVRSASHYVNRNGELWRYLTNNVTGQALGGRFLAGPAPAWMTVNVRYYSFDGIYFYTNPRNIRVDGSGAINANNPHFNYFQYLSFRSQSTITPAQLDAFLVNENNNPSWHSFNTTTSVMRNQGQAFIEAQARYGINALLLYAKAMHESAGGTSAIARNNNNLFGQGAVDSAPQTNAWAFETPAASINDAANGWLSRGYLWHLDWRNSGPHAGNKGSGQNVRYATDPYWGEKIAGWAFRLDRSRPLAERDLNREQIAIRQDTVAVNVQNNAGGTLYTANRGNFRFFPFLVIGTGTNNRLRVVTDTAIVNGVPNRTALFDRTTAIGYIPSGNVWLTGAATPNIPGTTPTPPNNQQPEVPSLQLPDNITQPTNRVQEVIGTTTEVLNLRVGPGTNYALVRELPNNTSVAILGTNANALWLLVRQNNQFGWVTAEFVNAPPLRPYEPSTPPPTTPTVHRGWRQDANLWYFYNQDGIRQTGWMQAGGHWYFLNPEQGQQGHTTAIPVGAMRDGWVQTGGRWYFLNPLTGQSGHATNRPHGAMRDGWISMGGHWYFMNPRSGQPGSAANVPHGAMREGWVLESGHWYFLNPRSDMAGHTANRPHGALRDGWMLIGSTWYFLNPATGANRNTTLPHGAMWSSNGTIDGVRQQFNAVGRWLGRG